MEGSACLADDFWQTLQLASDTVGIKTCIEPVGYFLKLELECHSVKQHEALSTQFVHLGIHDGA
jgi:hypothetical protein